MSHRAREGVGCLLALVLGCRPAGAPPASESVSPPAESPAVEARQTDREALVSGARKRASDLPASWRTGIPDCDLYAAEYRRCILDNGPEAVRQRMLATLRETVSGHQEFAAKAEAGDLEHPCRAAHRAAKITTARWGCSFTGPVEPDFETGGEDAGETDDPD